MPGTWRQAATLAQPIAARPIPAPPTPVEAAAPSDEPADFGPQDVVVIALKAYSVGPMLPRIFGPLIRVDVDDTGSCRFLLQPFGLLLLYLRLEPERSAPDRQLFGIDGGALVYRRNGVDPGRLEFREVLDGRFVLAAIHDFEPALPWTVYSITQALVHLWVMWRFARHLART